jgi:hypothetical protein
VQPYTFHEGRRFLFVVVTSSPVTKTRRREPRTEDPRLPDAATLVFIELTTGLFDNSSEEVPSQLTSNKRLIWRSRNDGELAWRGLTIIVAQVCSHHRRRGVALVPL